MNEENAGAKQLYLVAYDIVNKTNVEDKFHKSFVISEDPKDLEAKLKNFFGSSKEFPNHEVRPSFNKEIKPDTYKEYKENSFNYFNDICGCCGEVVSNFKPEYSRLLQEKDTRLE